MKLRALCIAASLLLATSVHAAGKDPIRSAVHDLGELYGGAGFMLTKKANTPIPMIYSYLYKTYNRDDVKNFKIVSNAKDWKNDQQIAGTLDFACVKKYAKIGYIATHQDNPKAEVTKGVAESLKLLEELKGLGVTFGFDGDAQNEGPTTMLLIIDPEHKRVFNIDLCDSEPF
jgi:hypothetical protein